MRPRMIRERAASAPDRPQRPASRRFRRLRTVTIFLLLVVAVPGAGGLALSSVVPAIAGNLVDELRTVTIRLGFTVGEIIVVGRNRTGSEALLQALAIHAGDPILDLELAAARQRIEALDWVERVEIERRLPDVLLVRVVEREPVAFWQRDGSLALIDLNGHVIASGGVSEFAGLPVVVTDTMARTLALRFLQRLGREPDLRSRVNAVIHVGYRRWNVWLDERVTVQLPEAAPLDAWSELARIERRHGILQRDIKTIDMRVKGQLVVRVDPMVANRVRDPGRDT